MENSVGSQPQWRKSSASGSGNCVEVARVQGIVVRDSKNPFSPVLGFATVSWDAFRRAQSPWAASTS
ncbi:DUF397 domain-containing protein [Yinghuangia seranimata]|nr:DUF397 domain-containing protein [Yinghuangia seranimata]MDI2124907.1 DUF397 domain-containing protein [Yinghuangia seranimata]